MSDPIAIVSRLYQALNARDFEELDRILTARWVDHGPSGDGTKADFIASFEEVLGGLPDLTVSFEHAFAGGEFVSARLLLSGHHRGNFFGVPATARLIRIRSNDIHRVVDGSIVESWQVEDWLSALEQIGARPS